MPKDFLNSDDLTCVLKLPGPGSHSPCVTCPHVSHPSPKPDVQHSETPSTQPEHVELLHVITKC